MSGVSVMGRGFWADMLTGLAITPWPCRGMDGCVSVSSLLLLLLMLGHFLSIVTRFFPASGSLKEITLLSDDEFPELSVDRWRRKNATGQYGEELNQTETLQGCKYGFCRDIWSAQNPLRFGKPTLLMRRNVPGQHMVWTGDQKRSSSPQIGN